MQFTLLTLLASVASANPYPRYATTRGGVNNACPVIFDGRVPANVSLSDFNTEAGGGWNPFNPGYVKGNNLTWSQIIKLPNSEPKSRFDAASGTQALEVTINDDSIFQKQYGFRRAGLQFAKDSNKGSPASTGVVTLHFSLLQYESRPLNLSHEYLNVWHEASDYSANQFNFQSGTLIDQSEFPENTWKLLNRNNTQIWSTPMKTNVWQNFAITLDYDKNTIQAWYSEGQNRLQPATKPVSNNNSGEGQFQIGVLKKPTGTSDVVNAGYQESGLNEGLIYGGIFVENSSNNNCISK